MTKTTKGFIYLIWDNLGEAYKIGMTKRSVEKRLKQLQTGCSNELTIVETFETEYPFLLESILHKTFAHKRLTGEWYALSLDDVKNFKTKCVESNESLELIKDNPWIKLR